MLLVYKHERSPAGAQRARPVAGAHISDSVV